MALFFQLDGIDAQGALDVAITELVVAGWTGRDASAIEHHIAELEVLGVPRPSSVPLFYRVAAQQLSQANVVQVLGAETSGEVEPFVFLHQGAWHVSIASDHTDRRLETHSVALSKQICPKPVAKTAWRLEDVQGHWDSLVLRSWIEEDGVMKLYQEGSLAALRSPADLLQRYAEHNTTPGDGFGMSCGTHAALGGIRSAPRFRMELEDAVLGRRITHEYRCTVLAVVA